MARRLASALLFLASAVPSFCQSPLPSLGLRVAPHAIVPLGESADLFRLGGGADVSILGYLSALPRIAPGLDVGADFAPVKVAGDVEESTLNLVRIGASAVLSHPIGDRLSLQARAAGGYYTGVLDGSDTGAVGGFYFGGGAGVSFYLSSRLSVDLKASYLRHQDLYSGLTAALGTTVRLSGSGGGPVPSLSVPPLRPAPLTAGGALKISDVRLDRIFPVLFKYYDDHPVGGATITNASRRPATDVEVKLSLEQYMDSPKTCARVERLEPGESREVALYALFNDSMLSVTEGTKAAARIRLDYRVDGRQLGDEASFTLEMYDRNALRWDDDRKIGAFVTARDDEVQRFAKNAASLLADERCDALPAHLHLAVVELAALKEHGLSYVVDPKSSYTHLSQDESAVDYVQFPRQTLQFKAGDCDDLSVAFAAILESVGVPTALITVPGHILPAVRLEVSEREARRALSSPEDLIVRPDGVWVPIETTILKQGFVEAWREGARQWREHSESGRAGFFTTAEAWSAYQPVAFGSAGFPVAAPSDEALRAAGRAEIARLVEREMARQEMPLLAALRQAPADRSARNRLGVVYARYGLEQKAREQFEMAVKGGEHAPALLNLGHLAFLDKNMAEAIVFYERAARADPRSAPALLALARAHHATENYGIARRYYDQLAALDSQLAQQYGYLKLQGAEAGRASDAARLTGVVVWGE